MSGINHACSSAAPPPCIRLLLALIRHLDHRVEWPDCLWSILECGEGTEFRGRAEIAPAKSAIVRRYVRDRRRSIESILSRAGGTLSWTLTIMRDRALDQNTLALHGRGKGFIQSMTVYLLTIWPLDRQVWSYFPVHSK